MDSRVLYGYLAAAGKVIILVIQHIPSKTLILGMLYITIQGGMTQVMKNMIHQTVFANSKISFLLLKVILSLSQK